LILIAGESLIDLIVDSSGGVHASPGGGPFNAARTMARLGQATLLLGRFSADPFGGLLMEKLSQDNVRLAVPDPVNAPTALAVVGIGGQGVPQYWFHLAETAGFSLDRAAVERALDVDAAALYVGALGLVVEPMATRLEQLIASVPGSVLVLFDPNCRPQATPDPQAFRARVRRILPRTDIVKASTEDLAFLLPGMDVPEAARALLEDGAGAVLVTGGSADAQAFTGHDHLFVSVPRVEVADTVGAGDAFGGAFLAWWLDRALTRHDLADPALLRAALAAAARVASLTCTRPGAEPPLRHELDAYGEWGQAHDA
jgi:fructokinase